MSTDSDRSTVPCRLGAGVGAPEEVGVAIETDLDLNSFSEEDVDLRKASSSSAPSSSSSSSFSSLDFSLRCAAAATVKVQEINPIICFEFTLNPVNYQYTTLNTFISLWILLRNFRLDIPNPPENIVNVLSHFR